MFVPTEGIGACVARIVSECGLKPLRMEFTEEKAVVEFAADDYATPSLRNRRTDVPAVSHDLPNEGWKHEGHKWRNGTLLMSVREISEKTGIPKNALRQRLCNAGRIETLEHRSKFDKISKRKRFALCETQKG